MELSHDKHLKIVKELNLNKKSIKELKEILSVIKYEIYFEEVMLPKYNEFYKNKK
jgi:hypothetical protein|tara:strand:+ start:1595 stop:1759 length:165 start_codon:yes stop_codon:yes gene_type:complete